MSWVYRKVVTTPNGSSSFEVGFFVPHVVLSSGGNWTSAWESVREFPERLNKIVELASWEDTPRALG
jgi:hypothetical protein